MESLRRIEKLDAIRISMKHLGKDLAGINPKLEIYKKKEKELEALNQQFQIIKQL